MPKGMIKHKQPGSSSKKPPGRTHGPDGFPIPQPPSSTGRHWVEASSGVDRDGTPWSIPGHWADVPAFRPSNPNPEPAFKNTHGCTMSGAFIVLGGYLNIYDDEVPPGKRGHHLYLSFGGVGVGGMDTKGALKIYTSSWDEFYDKVDAFAYVAAAPTLDIPKSDLAATAIVFYNSKGDKIGIATPDVSADIGLGRGSVSVRD